MKSTSKPATTKKGKTPPPKKAATKRAKSGAGKERRLTVQHERFAELVVAGESDTRAYIKSGCGKTMASAEKNAWRVREIEGVKNRIAELRKPQTKKTLMSKDMKRGIAMEIASNPAKSDMARIRAMELDAKLAGHFEPDRVEVETGPYTLESIRERAKTVASLMSLAHTVQ
jgi:hypothetical protein